MLKDGEVYKEGAVDDFDQSTDPFITSFFKL
jgi:ABC-type transporter Mla maintaining outer membrane lipid asymmetry ATPase subunit MlaF